MPKKTCAQFRKKVVLFLQILQQPEEEEFGSVQSFIREARKCCDDCRLFLSAELAIHETMIHILPRDSRKATCLDDNQFRAVFRLTIGIIQQEKTSGKRQVALFRKNINALKKWVAHEKICADCQTYFESTLQIVLLQEKAFRQEIYESRFPLESSSTPRFAYVM